ncbi:S8 family serine peptidase [Nonlabens sp.]|uniref:S8 family serine peptidase n=1 Tax=Nonlabens sp. TaxID=1888209 RepID=UPI003F696232
MFQKTINNLIFLLLGSAILSTAQTNEERRIISDSYNQEQIISLNNYLNNYSKTNSIRLKLLKATYDWPETIQTKSGNTAYLIGVNDWDSPLYVSTMNEEAAQMQGARELQTGGSFGLNIEGQDMTVGVWDGGQIRDSHLSYFGRTVPGEALTTLSGHATHVAGTIASNGAGDSAARGIAPQSTIEYYEFQRLPESQGGVLDAVEMSAAAASGMLVSNHSYGIPADVISNSDLGKYDSTAQSWDQVARTYEYYLIVSSAGNSRNTGVNPSDGGYDLLTSRSNAKNNLVVGATEGVANYTGPSSVSMSNFSSWGPTDDGRIKPDISTKGVAMYSTSELSDTQYSFRSGTSMSSPAVAAGAILLQQYYNSLNNNYMKAATLKGLMLHTADEAGRFDGPDYAFGWGLLNTEKAATAIRSKGNEASISELSLSQGTTYTETFTSTGNLDFDNKLVISISWTDTPANNLPSLLNDDRAPMIVNDLDLVVTSSSGTVYYPWKLDPDFPNTAATTGVNDVDNYEKIEIDQLTGDFTVSVSHKGSLFRSRAQNFSLIVTGVTSGTLSTDLNELNSLKLFPNPANDQFNVSLGSANFSKEVSIDVFDILGKQIMSNTYDNSGNFEQSIDVSQLNSGIYLVRVRSGKTFETRKLIVK